LDSGELYLVAAHESDFYAFSLFGDDLATVGLEDQQLKRWRPGEAYPVQQWRLPDRVASMALIDSCTLTVVTAEGYGRLYSLRTNNWERSYEVPGRSLRVVLVSNQAESEGLVARHRRTQAREIMSHVFYDHTQADPAAFALAKRQLAELDYGHYDDALEGLQAFRSGDIPLAVSSFTQWRERLREAGPLDTAWFSTCGAAFEQAELPAQAIACYELVRALHPEHAVNGRLINLRRKAAAIAHGAAVIESALEIPLLIRAAEAAGVCFQGWFVVRPLSRTWLFRATLAPEAFVEAHQSTDRGRRSVPAAFHRYVTWFGEGSGKSTNAQIVGFGQHQVDAPSVRFVLRFRAAGRNTLVRPVLLIGCDCLPPETSPTAWNAWVLRVWDQLDATDAAAWGDMATAAHRLLAMLENRACAPETL
jgi:hypothetical protein